VAGQEISSAMAASGSTEDHDSGSEAGSFSEWKEAQPTEVDGFFGTKLPSAEAAWQELAAACSFDFLDFLRNLEGERMYAYIKLVNFIRQNPGPHLHDWSSFSAFDLQSDDLLEPVLPDDLILQAYSLVDDSDGFSDEDSEAQ
jgi:hypothetical protein